MINIEGTPHEKALIVISSYIIGFVSAYIAFTYAFPVNGPQPVMTYVPVPSQAAAVIESQEQVAAPAQPEALVTDAVIDVVYENQGLYLYGVADEPVLLSKSAEVLDVTYDEDMSLWEKQGLHSTVPAYRYLPEQGLVYYCESYENPDECVPYIYDIAEQTLRVVQAQGTPVVLDAATAPAADVNGAGRLQFGEYTAINATTPWRVAR